MGALDKEADYPVQFGICVRFGNVTGKTVPDVNAFLAHQREEQFAVRNFFFILNLPE